MPTIIVNDLEVEIGPDEQLNGIEAAKRAGVEIPHYCWHPGLSVVASCRMCLVETGPAMSLLALKLCCDCSCVVCW